MIEFMKWWDSYGCFITQHNSESSIDFRIRVAEAAWEHAYHEGLSKMKELQGIKPDDRGIQIGNNNTQTNTFK